MTWKTGKIHRVSFRVTIDFDSFRTRSTFRSFVTMSRCRDDIPFDNVLWRTPKSGVFFNSARKWEQYRCDWHHCMCCLSLIWVRFRLGWLWLLKTIQIVCEFEATDWSPYEPNMPNRSIQNGNTRIQWTGCKLQTISKNMTTESSLNSNHIVSIHSYAMHPIIICVKSEHMLKPSLCSCSCFLSIIFFEICWRSVPSEDTSRNGFRLHLTLYLCNPWMYVGSWGSVGQSTEQ